MSMLTENDAPQAFANQPEAKLTPYFRSIAHYVDDEKMGKAIVAAKDIVKERYARTRLEGLFKIERGQFGSCLTEAGGRASWTPLFEEFASMKFISTPAARSGTPSTCTLIGPSSSRSPRVIG
jgi:hypothetical protein